MKTVTTSVAFQDALGAIIANGKLVFDLSQSGEVTSGGGQIVPRRVVLSLNSSALISPTQMWFNDELTPNGTTYHLTVLDSNLNLIADIGQITLAGASADLSLIVPTTSGGASSVGAVLLNPAAQQNINGQTLNMEGAALGFSAPASTTADVFLSRSSAGIAQIGTSTSNAAGTLTAANLSASSTVSAGDGTASAPGYVFASNTNRGFFNDGSFGGVGLVFGGATKAYVYTAGLTVGPNVYGFASAINGSVDTGLSRTGAAVIAVGNGTAADVTGTLNAAAYQVSGTAMNGSGGGLVRATSPTITTATLASPTISGTASFLGQTLTAFRIQNFSGLTVTSPTATDGQEFTTTLIWSSPFADSNYLVIAQMQNASAGSPVASRAAATSASQVLVTLVQVSAVQATVTEILLIGFHL